jgi:hypothetical protein
MKKIIAILALVMMVCAPAFALDHYRAEVYKLDDLGNRVRITDTVWYQVLSYGTSDDAAPTEETIYSDSATTIMTKPVTAAVFATTDRVEFWCDSTTAGYVDLIVTDTNGGYSVRLSGFTPYDHSIVIDERSGAPHMGMTKWAATTSMASVDTGVNFLKNQNIKTVFVNVATAGSGVSLDVGLNSSTDYVHCFVDSASAATAGWVRPSLTTSGPFLDDGTNYYPHGYVSAGAQNLVYSTDTTVAGAWGYIVWEATPLR